MDLRAAMAGERTVRRIVPMLVALAALAEQAAGRSAPVRLVVLWLLRRAEAVAGDYFLAITGVPFPAEAFITCANGPDDAMSLAERLRRLAAFLAALLPDAGPLDRRPAPARFASGFRVLIAARAAGTLTPQWNDTS